MQCVHFQVDNTDKWRSELNSLASSVGLLTQNDIEDLRKKKERDEMIKSLNKKPNNPTSQRNKLSSQSLKTPGTSKSQRLNEPLLTGRRTSRFSRAGSKGVTTGNKYIVNQADREAWVKLNTVTQLWLIKNVFIFLFKKKDAPSFVSNFADRQLGRCTGLVSIYE